MPDPIPPGDPSPLDELISFLRDQRSFDFASYPAATFERLVNGRIDALELDAYDAYVDHLAVHPEEFDHLFDTLLSGAVEFFSDSALWEELRANCLPALLEAKAPDRTLRIWVAGTAQGHEAYSAAMLGADLLGRDEALERLKIHATDIDADALESARRGWFPADAMGGVPDALRERYFHPVDGGFAFDEDLRRRMIFGRHDLLHDTLIPRIDLLVCRNVLMYFTAEAQARLVERFDHALAPHGYLVLGRAELLLARAGPFEPVGPDLGIFSKVTNLSGRLLAMYLAEPALQPVGHAVNTDDPTRQDQAAEAFELATSPQLVVDSGGHVALANRAARAVLHDGPSLTGRPVDELELADPSLELRTGELRSALREAAARRRPVMRRHVTELVHGGSFDAEVLPMSTSGKRTDFLVSFHDATEAAQRLAQLEGVQRQLETVHGELHAMNVELASANGELRSTVEEMEAMNSELEGANRALEQMDHELAASHAEVATVHEQLRAQTTEVDRGQGLLLSVLDVIGNTSGDALIVLDSKLTVRGWNRRSTALWGIPASQAIGRKLNRLAIDVPARLLAELAGADVTARAPDAAAHAQPQMAVNDRADQSGGPTQHTFRWTMLSSSTSGLDGAVVWVSAPSSSVG